MKALSKIDFKAIFLLRNRGILLDVVVFFLNVFLMTVLSSRLRELIDQSKQKDSVAVTAITLYCLALCFLPPLGAVLKRRRAHLRNPDLSIDFDGFFKAILVGQFLLELLFLITIALRSLELAKEYSGKDYSSALFLYLFLGIPLLAAINTAIVFFYFVKPRHDPFLKLFNSPWSEKLGDVCIFLNMILCQAFWGILMTDLTKDYSGLFDRIFFFIFSGVIIYLPPRIFYLAEDRERTIIWLTMLLANLPVILRIFFT